jgi:hypothetical protein
MSWNYMPASKKDYRKSQGKVSSGPIKSQLLYR